MLYGQYNKNIVYIPQEFRVDTFINIVMSFKRKMDAFKTPFCFQDWGYTKNTTLLTPTMQQDVDIDWWYGEEEYEDTEYYNDYEKYFDVVDDNKYEWVYGVRCDDEPTMFENLQYHVFTRLNTQPSIRKSISWWIPL